jgi:hypothetical protein
MPIRKSKTDESLPHPSSLRITPKITEKGDGQGFLLFETIRLSVAKEFKGGQDSLCL